MRRRAISVVAVAVALVAAGPAFAVAAGATPTENDVTAPDVPSSAAPSTTRPAILGTTADQDDAGLAVSIDDLEPRVLTTQDGVVISGTVTNTSGTDLADPELDVLVRAKTPVTVGEVTTFLSGDQDRGRDVFRTTVGRDLPAGASTSFTINVPTGDLPLGDPFDWGPRGLTVQASSGQASGQDRSLLVWDSGYDVSPTIIDTLVPWTTAAAATTPVGIARERNVLLSLASTDGVTLAVDPELLPTLDALGTDLPGAGDATQSGDPSASATPTPSSPTATASPSPRATDTQSGMDPDVRAEVAERAFTRELLAAAPEIVALPRWDADLGTLTLGGAPDLLGLASQSRTRFASAAGAGRDGAGSATVLDDVVWPTSDTFGLQVLHQYPDQTVIAPPGALAPTEALPFTSVSRVEVDSASGATSATGEADGTVTVLTTQQSIADVLAWNPPLAGDRLDAEQSLSALTAIITREKPNDSRTLLAAVPRGTVVNDALAGRVHALLGQRWVSGTTFSALAASDPTDVKRAPVTDAPGLDAPTSDAFRAVSEALAQATALASALDEPDALTADITDAALRMLSAGTSAEERSTAAARLRVQAVHLASSVHAEPTSTINLINKTAAFPVPVTNDLDWPVTVRVTLAPSDPRLQVTQAQEVTIPPGTSTTVEVPVSAIGSGNIRVGYRVSTPDGHVLDDTQSVTVRMRAGWEDTGTAAIAALLAVALVVGVARTLAQRLRANRRTEGPPDAGLMTTEEG